MRRQGISKLLTCVSLTVILAVTIAEAIGEDVAESREMRGPRCEHHDHDGKRPTTWLGKLKRTKTQYASSKPNSRPKSHYGQPHSHSRPPKPQYIPPRTNFRIPAYSPPAPYLVPHLSHSAVQNSNSLQPAFYSPQQYPNNRPQASYRPQKNPNSLPQALSYDPPAYVSSTPTEAPSYALPYDETPHSQSPEDFEDLSLPMSVYTPPAQVHNPPSPYIPAQSPVKESSDSTATADTEDSNYLTPAYSPNAYTVTTTSPSPSYTETTHPQIHSSATSAYDPAIEAEITYFPSSSLIPVYDSPTTYPPHTTSTEYPGHFPPSHADLTYPEPHGPPVPTEPPAEPYKYNPPSLSESPESTPGHYFPPDQNKYTPYPLQDPTSSDSVPHYPHTSTEAPYYLSESTEALHYPTTSTEAPYYPPASTEKPYYFPLSYSDAPYPEPQNPPAPIHNVPTSYSSPSFPSFNFPSYSLPSFMEAAEDSLPGYEDAVYPSPNHRTSGYKPISHETEEFFQRNSFPRFNEFLQQMLRGKM